VNADTLMALFVVALQIGIPVSLVALGYFAGRRAERKHYASIHEREARFLNLPAVSFRQWDKSREVAEARLVAGSVVISADYFKRLLAALRNIFGGRMRAYESLVDRARREAILRLKEQCPNADIIVNLRVETSTIHSKKGKGGISSVELMAYGTAIRYRSAGVL
jgi:uncharacterized protein YbjQ (UPF0145 family)